jgi:O-antigen ligase
MILSKDTIQSQHFLMLYAFLLPIIPLAANWVLPFFILFWLFVERKSWRNLWQLLVLLPIIWWLWHFVTTCYPPLIANNDGGLGVKLSFILLPIFIVSLPHRIVSLPHRIVQSLPAVLAAFAAGIGAASLICLGAAAVNFAATGETKYFFYTYLTKILDLHPAYVSWQLCFCLFAGIAFAKANWATFSIFQQRLVLTFLAYLVVFNVLLSARIGLVAMLLVGILWFIYECYVRRQLLRGSFILLGFAGLIVVAITQISFLKWRFASLIPSLVAPSQVASLPVDSRAQAWHGATTLIAEHPIMGVGICHVTPQLNAIYTQQNAVEALATHLNTHNQFLQTQLGTGIVGSFILIAILVALLYFSRAAAPLLRTVIGLFVLLFVLFGLTESVLERQSGTMFFAFFYSLFVLWLSPNTTHRIIKADNTVC